MLNKIAIFQNRHQQKLIKSNTMKMESSRKTSKEVWGRIVDLASQSTAHGWSNMFRTENSLIRILWILIFLGFSGFFGFLFIGSIKDYLRYDVTTKTRFVSESSMKFPALTFCNYKPLMTSTAYEYTTKEFINGNFFEVNF